MARESPGFKLENTNPLAPSRPRPSTRELRRTVAALLRSLDPELRDAVIAVAEVSALPALDTRERRDEGDDLDLLGGKSRERR